MGQENTQIDIHKYITLFLRRKWLVIISVAVFSIGAIFYALITPDVYESECVLLLEDSSALEQLMDKQAGAGRKHLSAGSVIQVVRQKMLSWKSVIENIKFLELDKDLDKSDPVGLQKLYANILKHMNLQASGKNLIRVSYRGDNPEINFRILDGLVSNFFETSIKKSRDEVGATLEFINEDLKRLKRNLDESEQVLIRFEEDQMEDLPAIEGARDRGKKFRLSIVKGELDEINRTIDEVTDRIAFLEERKSEVGETRTDEITKVPNPKIDDLNKRINDLEITISTMRSKYYDEHPRIQEALKTLASFQKMLEGEPKEIVAEEKISSNPMYDGIAQQSLEAQLALKSLQRSRKETEGELATLKESVKGIPALRQESLRLTRNYELNKSMYENRLAHKAKAELAKEMSLEASVNPFRIVEPARISYEPLKSVKIMIVGMGFVMGLGLGVGLVIGMDKIDHRFKTMEDVQDYLNLPALGMIPTILTHTEIKRKFKQKIVISASTAVFVLVSTMTCYFVEPVRTKVNIGWDKLIELARNN